MKKIGTHTILGALETSSTAMDRLQLFDGRFDTGYRITDFEISLRNRASNSTVTVSAKLATEDVGDNEKWFWSDNREIAWASAGADANGLDIQTPQSIIDEDNLIVEDLFIGAHSYAGAGTVVNYMIKLEKYDITDWQGALAMVRNKSQG